MRCNLLFWIISVSFIISTSSANLETLHEWKYLGILWEPIASLVLEGNKFVSRVYSSEDVFNLFNAVPFDVDMSSDGRIFITVIPKNNVVYTLMTVSNVSLVNGPVLEPYPNSSWHVDIPGVKNCKKLRSVSGIMIDACNRLWVVDSGRIEDVQSCPAKLLVFNLTDNNLIKSYEIPKNVSENVNGKSYLVNPVVHTNKLQCDKFEVFIADTEGYGLITFDGTTFRRFEGYEYNPQFQHYRFKIANENFTRAGGILPMDLEPTGKHLFFAPLSSRSLYAQSTKPLIDGIKPKYTGANNIFDGQATAFRWSIENYVLFAGLTTNKIICWSGRNKLCEDDFDTVAEDSEKLQYISALKIIPAEKSKSGKEELLVLTNRLQKNINENINLHEINFRILKAPVEQLIKDTACAAPICDECYYQYYGTIMD